MFVSMVLSILAGLIHDAAFFVSYISGSNAFPQPLSEEEEAEYLARLAAGDESARSVLVERNLRLVAHIVKKFDNTGEDMDDLISIGTIGLIKAIRTFDSSKNTRLATYAARCIENEILMHLRSSKKVRSELMLQDPIGADKEGNEITLLDILGTDGDEVLDTVELSVEQEKLHRKMEGLTSRERRVLELRYGLTDGSRRTQREISKKLGISRSYVSRIEKRAISKLYQAMCSQS